MLFFRTEPLLILYDVLICRRKESYKRRIFASLAGLTRKNGGSDYKYDNLAYEEFAGIIDKYSSVPQVDKLRFF